MKPEDMQTSELILFMIQWHMVKSYAIHISYTRFKELEDNYPAIRDELNARIPSMKEAKEGI